MKWRIICLCVSYSVIMFIFRNALVMFILFNYETATCAGKDEKQNLIEIKNVVLIDQIEFRVPAPNNHKKIPKRARMAAEKLSIYIGSIIDCVENINIESNKSYILRSFDKGFVAVRGNKIVGIDFESSLDEFIKVNNFHNATIQRLSDTQILIPGLIDTHIHAPQYPNCGLGYDKPLLEWLQKYTYPLEKKYKDLDFSKKVFDSVVKRTLSHGTTTACYFASMYADSSIVLVDSALKYGQRALIGKINMQRFCPDDYKETYEESLQSTKKFIDYVEQKGGDLVKPIITPRFAPSCEPRMLKELGEIAKKHDLHIQSHISENVDEIGLVRSLFNNSYAEVYDNANLLTNKTIMAHAVHLEDSEIKLFAERGTAVAHCPISNTDLQSGLCDVSKLLKAGVKVGLGTDISGGDSPSIVATMRAALQTSVHLSYGKNDYTPINYIDAFYLATLGGAQALSMEDTIGNFKVGKDFDALLVDLDVKNAACDFINYRVHEPMELLQKFIYVGDDRNIKDVYVSGIKVK